MKRWLLLTCVVVFGAAAPARAWCEATCLAPSEASASHCSTHDPADGTVSISASQADACPVLESARPTLPARLDVNASPTETYVSPVSSRTHVVTSFVRPHGAVTVFERCIPIRI